jgi:hypothetical protein
MLIMSLKFKFYEIDLLTLEIRTKNKTFPYLTFTGRVKSRFKSILNPFTWDFDLSIGKKKSFSINLCQYHF